jgi:hypothetical protein
MLCLLKIYKYVYANLHLPLRSVETGAFVCVELKRRRKKQKYIAKVNFNNIALEIDFKLTDNIKCVEILTHLTIRKMLF